MTEEILLLQNIACLVVASWVMFALYSYLLRRQYITSKFVYAFDVSLGVACLVPLCFASVQAVVAIVLFPILIFSVLPVYNPNFIPWWHRKHLFNCLLVYLLLLMLLCVAVAFFNENTSAANISLSFVLYTMFILAIFFLSELKRQNAQLSKNTQFNNIVKIYFNIYSVALIISAVIISLISIIVMVLLLVDAKGISNDICLDTGYCHEGIVLNNCFDEGTECVINKENCDKMQGIWIEQNKSCQTKTVKQILGVIK